MRIIIFLLLIVFTSKPVICQQPSKKEMQTQMLEAVNEINKQVADLEKQIAEAKKNKEDEETIKDLEDQLAMLKKQAAMMGGVNKSLSGISEKTFQQAGEEEAIAPKKDVTRIGMLPKKILNDAELALFIKNVHSQVEKMIPAAEKAEAIKVYNETKTQYKSVAITANAASGYWMLGHWEKALYIMGRACIEDITDADNLNNYAAFLISTGAEQAALPILQYLDSKYPKNSTIINNIGQAWFGLGDLDNAKKNLDEATVLYPGHSMANATLSNVHHAEGDNERAITFLKASLKETYDPEKEQQLLNLGYKITYFDMPPFDYPMKKDPLGLIPLLDTWNPATIQKSLNDESGALALQRYLNGIKDFEQELDAENEVLDKKLIERNEKLGTDSGYRQEFLEPYNCPAYLQAGRSLQLLMFDVAPGITPLITQLMLPFSKSFQDPGEIPISDGMILKDCQEIWYNDVLKPIGELSKVLTDTMYGIFDCRVREMLVDAYLQKRSEIYQKGVELIKTEFVQKFYRLDAWIKLNLYASKDQPPTDDDLTKALISHLKGTIMRTRFKNKVYKSFTKAIDLADACKRLTKKFCDYYGPDSEPGTENMSGLNVRFLDCEFRKTFITPIRYKFFLICNTIVDEKGTGLEEKKPDINKGSVQNSARANQSPGPLQTSGPHISLEAPVEKDNSQPGPLTQENKVASQCYLEYNKYGNFVGFKFQLNEDGTQLKDPDSIESGIDSRWSWNAIASPKKGFLNKILIK